jgi:hypothetical protein
MLEAHTYKFHSLDFTLKKGPEEAALNTDETKKADRPLFIAKYSLILKEFGF